VRWGLERKKERKKEASSCFGFGVGCDFEMNGGLDGWCRRDSASCMDAILKSKLRISNSSAAFNRSSPRTRQCPLPCPASVRI